MKVITGWFSKFHNALSGAGVVNIYIYIYMCVCVCFQSNTIMFIIQVSGNKLGSYRPIIGPALQNIQKTSLTYFDNGVNTIRTRLEINLSYR
jgi:hypothetical protein